MRRALVLLLLAAGCTPAPMPEPAAGQGPPRDAMAPADVAAGAAEPVANDLGTPIADQWVGEWRGPEGTSLEIEKQEVGYRLVISNLDGPREFHGIGAQDLMEFERDGKRETLRAGDGAATGMKWLAEKRDCLVVREGEGYCRD